MIQRMLAISTAAALATAADAGFVGWVGVVHVTATHRTMDVFAGMSQPTDKLLSVFNMNIVAQNCEFIQQAGAATNKWRPNFAVSAMGDIDSFVTMGGYHDGASYICGDTTTGGPAFTNYAVSNATTIAANAEWFASNPTSPQVVATDIAPFAAGGSVAGGSASANYGVWIAHFAVLKDFGPGFQIAHFSGSAAFNTGGSTFDSRTLFISSPAPGALALFGAAGFVRSRRRAVAPRSPLTSSVQ